MPLGSVQSSVEAVGATADLRSRLHRVSVRLCERSFQFPATLVLDNIEVQEGQPAVHEGGYAKVNIGQCDGKFVALKTLKDISPGSIQPGTGNNITTDGDAQTASQDEQGTKQLKVHLQQL